MSDTAESLFVAAMRAVEAEDADLEQVLASLGRALELEPEHAGASELRAAILTEKGIHLLDVEGDPAAALECLEESLQLRPDSSETWYATGLALGDAGRHQEAISRFERAAPDLGGFADAAIGDANLALERWDLALAAYDRALSQDPELAAAWFGRAQASEAAGEPEDVRTACQRFLELVSEGEEAAAARELLERCQPDA